MPNPWRLVTNRRTWRIELCEIVGDRTLLYASWSLDLRYQGMLEAAFADFLGYADKRAAAGLLMAEPVTIWPSRSTPQHPLDTP